MNAITGESGRLATRAPFMQSDIGNVTVGRRTHDGLVEIIFCAKKLSLELVDIGLALLDIEGAAGVAELQLRHLGESQFLELDLRADGIDLRLVRDWIDLE